MSLAIIFLARGRGAGLEALAAFLETYVKHPAEIEHELIVLKKGWDGIPGANEVEPLVVRHGGRVIELPDDGFDWGAYMRAAQAIDHEWVVFLNTHSRILAESWARHLQLAAQRAGVGAAGATGSWGTIRPMPHCFWPMIRRVAETRGYVKAAFALSIGSIRFLSLWLLQSRRYPAFPNPHLRSNAFLMRRSLFVDYAHQAWIPRTKHEAFELESGFKGLTRWLGSKGLDVVVVGIGGRSFQVHRWDTSETFRFPGHANLLVGDNQTRAYDNIDPGARWIMEMSAWGRTFEGVRAHLQDLEKPDDHKFGLI